jgi:hypothetical protein
MTMTRAPFVVSLRSDYSDATAGCSSAAPPRPDSNNKILCAFLPCALAMPDPMPSGRPKTYRDWSFDELAIEMGWEGAWLAGAVVSLKT